MKLQIQPLIPDFDIVCHPIDEEENFFAGEEKGPLEEKSCKRARFSMSDVELNNSQPAPRIVKRRFSFDLNVRRSFTPAPLPLAPAPVVVVPFRGTSPAPTSSATKQAAPKMTMVTGLLPGIDDVRVRCDCLFYMVMLRRGMLLVIRADGIIP